MTATTAPGKEALNLIREQTLATEIRKYLVHLAMQAKTPIEMSIRAQPQGIVTDVYSALLMRDQQYLPRKEELAAHEFTDPHNALSMDKGRQELSEVISNIAIPLADNTWSQDVSVDLTIGHDLPSPFAEHGMAMCVAFDCKRGVMRQRFSPLQESEVPAYEKPITVGMTMVARPGKIGVHPVHEDIGRGWSFGLLQSDAALYRWTTQALVILDGLKSQIELRNDVDQQNAIRAASDGLRANAIVTRMKREKAAEDVAAVVAAEAALEVMEKEDEPFSDQLQRILNSVKRITPALGEAVQNLQEVLKRPSLTVTPRQTPVNTVIASQEHKAAGSMLAAQQKPAPTVPRTPHHNVGEPQPVPDDN